MDELMLNGGRLVGVLGAILIAIAGAARVAGQFWIGGYQVGTLMTAGIAAVSLGCFALMWVIAGRSRA